MWKRPFPRRFNVEYTWSVCRVVDWIFTNYCPYILLPQCRTFLIILGLETHSIFAKSKVLSEFCQHLVKIGIVYLFEKNYLWAKVGNFYQNYMCFSNQRFLSSAVAISLESPTPLHLYIITL